MSISSQLLILNQTKQNVRTAINNKGVTVTDEAFAEYPDKVRLIPNGGGIYESNIILYIEGKLKNAVIPSGTTSIGKYAFSDCSNLLSVSIPNSVTSIGDYAFYSCSGLSSISLSNYVTSIGFDAFWHCTGLTTLTIPDGVTTIDRGAFASCSNIEDITVGTGVTSIGSAAFRDCTSLDDFTILATVPPTIGTDVFSNTNNCPIYVPDASVLAYQTATNWDTYSARITGISNKPV